MNGIYDWWILHSMKRPYVEKRFKFQTLDNDFLEPQLRKAKTMFEFD